MRNQRGKNVIVKSQFNVNGSRGKSVKPFITDYVTREDASDKSLAYIGSNEVGDGVSFTLNNTAISRNETLRIADVAEDFLINGRRAIQQMVVSFSHEYLVEQNIIDADTVITKSGDYRGQYDDVRLRHAIRSGVQSLCDLEGYRDPQMVAVIQHDTLHLHAHIVVFENYPKTSRPLKGKNERGLIKPSSFNEMTHEIDRQLTRGKAKTTAITQNKLLPKHTPSSEVNNTTLVQNQDVMIWLQSVEMLQSLTREFDEEIEQEDLQNQIDINTVIEDRKDNYGKIK